MTTPVTLPNEMFLPVFEEVLDWQLNILRRYPQATVTVFVIEPAIAHLAEDAQLAALNDFRAALRRTIRASDLVARGLGSEVWLLLPHSDGAGALARMNEVFGASGKAGYRSAMLDIQYGMVMPDNGAQLMGDLRQQLAD